MLDRAARGRLRTLSKNNADLVARHLVMAGSLVDDDPAAAYEHAQAAMRRAGRVDIVREALAVTAYATGNYAEALRELRTVRRLSGIDAHRPMEADCERGLGRPERALTVVAESDPSKLSEHDRVELAIVASGARADLGETEAGLLVLESSLVGKVTQPDLKRRLDLVRADRLEELGRSDEADALRAAAGPEPEPEEEIFVVDLEGEFAEVESEQARATSEIDDAAHEDSVARVEPVVEERTTPDLAGKADGAAVPGEHPVSAPDAAVPADDTVAEDGPAEEEPAGDASSEEEAAVPAEAGDDAGSPERADTPDTDTPDTAAPDNAAPDEASDEPSGEVSDEDTEDDTDQFEQPELDLDVSDKERE
jgi:hypothetical protein